MNTKNFALVAVTLILLAGITSADNIYDQTYTVSGAGGSMTPQFVVQELKYEPFPVKAGDTFNIWVKVQNVGQNDAPNAEFKLDSSYPFTVSNGVQDYGIIFGTLNAYKAQQQTGDTAIQANQAVVEFTVTVANDAPSGQDTIQFEATTDKASGNYGTFSIPITVSNSQTYTGINSAGQNTDNSYMNWVYGAIGFLAGAVIIILARLVLKRKPKRG